MYIVSPAHAVSVPLKSGVSGSCTWTYEQIDGDTVLTIVPAKGTEGMLGSFSWSSSQHKEITKRVVVKGTVNARSSSEAMFKYFK